MVVASRTRLANWGRVQANARQAARCGAPGRLLVLPFGADCRVRLLRMLGEVLGDEGWMKFLKLDEYAPRRPRLPNGLQQVLFPHSEAVKKAAPTAKC